MRDMMDENNQTKGLEGDNQEPQQINENESPRKLWISPTRLQL